MAFIGAAGIFAILLAILCFVIVFDIAMIIIGTILVKKNKYKKLGTGMRIIGFTVIMPVIIVIIVAIIYK